MSLNHNLSKTSPSNKIIRSRSSDLSHKRGRPRRHTLPTTILNHHNIISHPYFSQHAHHLCNYSVTSDNSIDTSLLNEGIVFYQNPNNGEIDYCWENELETCSPSLMPENTENFPFYEISGDSLNIDEKYLQNINKQQQNLEFVEPTKEVDDNDDDDDDMEILHDKYIENDEYTEEDEIEMSNLTKEMTDLLSNNYDQELNEQGEQEESEEEDPPSPLSPRDPEREGPVLSEEEENTEEGGIYRLEHNSEFQDEAGLDTEDSGGTDFTDDEGMDPMENR